MVDAFGILVAFGAALVAWVLSQRRRKPDALSFLRRSSVASCFAPVRLATCVLPQFLGANPRSSEDSDLSGKLILVTGGTRGIGLEIAKGLARRGADVVIASRNAKQGEAAVANILSQLSADGKDSLVKVKYVQVDMADLMSVTGLVKKARDMFPNRKFDQLIQNAGILPTKHSLSPQGHEIAFAANVLGPHLLLRKMIDEEVLKEDGKVIFTAGDLYITLKGTGNVACTPDFTYLDRKGGEIAYCRSKLGVIWLFLQLRERFPSLHANLVHPGVVDSELVEGGSPAPKPLLISNEEGAQTTLILATECTENGAFYHNTMGKVIFSAKDPANNPQKGLELWQLVEKLIIGYL